MKQRLFFSVLMTMAVAYGVKAQTEQGNFLAGGNLQLGTAKNNTAITVSPTLGYFFTDDFAAGANLDFNYSKKGESPYKSRFTRFGFGPFVRYYVGTTNIRPFLHGDVNFLTEKRKTSSQPSVKATGLGYFFAPGAAIFLNPNVALEGLAGYEHFAYKDKDGSGGFAFKVGFQVYLNRAQVKSVTNNL